MSSRLVSTNRLVLLILIIFLLPGCLELISNGIDNDATETIVDTPITDETAQRTTSQTPSPTATATATATASATATATASATATVTPTATATEISDNPWGESTLTVAIRDKEGGTRRLAPEIREALAYWEQNSERYAGYPIEFRLVPNATNPDILVSLVSRIETCGGGEDVHVAGCTRRVRWPILVQIETGYTDESLVRLLIHEFGHVLGLRHGDAPKEIMDPTVRMTTLPRPDATERDLPWNHSTLTVAVDLSNVPPDEHATVKRQINEALEYYENGADGTVPERVSFRRVSDPESADITIQFSANSPCPRVDSVGSCNLKYGYDPDGDGAFETYGYIKIILTNIDSKAVGWHVGYQLGFGFGFNEPEDWPEPLRPNVPIEVRRSRWWTS